MKLKAILATMLLAICGQASAQMQMPPIPTDPDVRIGKLDNGLVYYIRHNEWPEHRADFYIAQRVGSLQEEESQRGLAHFLEHMCFNGTKHFPGDKVKTWLETVGVKFGQELNAYTSIDETVYNINNVPTARQSALDSCLIILADWSGDLLLEDEEIDKERGVIHEEWRLRSSPMQRMLERNLEALYPGSKYGKRMPIGLMSVIDNFKYKELRDYYAKWYNPNNQAVVVVGDVDVDYIESKIKELFSPFTVPAGAGVVEAVDVPDNAEPIVIIDKDKEQRVSYVEVMFKHEPFPTELKQTPAYLMSEYASAMATTMLDARLNEATLKADCPFVGAGSGDGHYIFAKTKDCFELTAMPKDGQAEAALKAVMVEARRAAEFGFTATEYKRAQSDFLSQLEKQYSNKDKRKNTQFAEEYYRNFLDNEPIPSIDYYYQTMKMIVPQIPVEMINMQMAEWMPKNDSNIVVLSVNTDKEGAVIPTKDGLLKAIADARAEQITAYVDNVKDEPLITEKPKPGSIKKEVKNDKLGYTKLTLSNGATVLLKQTDFKKDQVVLFGQGKGGYSLYGEKDFENLKVIDDVVEASGLGNFSHTELEKALAGKIAGASFSLQEESEIISGNSTPTDVETMLQLVYLYFTKINKDQESYDNWMKTAELTLQNKALSPDAAYSDSIGVTVSGHDKRTMPLTKEMLSKVSYDRCLEIARERLSNANGFTFTIIGNFDEQTIRPLIEQYLASLPSQKKVQEGKRVDKVFKGKVDNVFKRKQETPKSVSAMVWYSEDIANTLDNRVKISMIGQILSMEYINKIREEASAAYSASAQGTLNANRDYTTTQLLAYCPMKPEKQELARSLMRSEVEAASKSIDAEKLQKVKEFMLKNYDSQVKTNGYWLQAIALQDMFGLDVHTDYKKTVEAQTPETISAFVRELLKSGNCAEITMLPEE